MHELVAIGFIAVDGTLRAPVGSTVTLTPVDGRCYRLTIALPHGGVVTGRVVELKTTDPVIDVDALISGTPRRRPW